MEQPATVEQPMTRRRISAPAFIVCALWALSAGCLSGPKPEVMAQSPDELIGGAPDDAQADSAASSAAAHDAALKAEHERPGELWYHVSMAQEETLELSLRLLKPAKRTSLFLPGAWAGRDDYAQAIRIKGVVGPSGQLPMTLWREQGRLDVMSEGQPWIELRYEVQLSKRHGERERLEPQRLEGGFLAYAPTFLILPSERVARSLRAIPIEVQLPQRLEMVTSWASVGPWRPSKREGYKVGGFLASDIGQLRDAFISAAPKLELHTSEATALTVAYAPSYKGDKAKLNALIERVVITYQRRFNPVGPVAVLVHSPPQTQTTRWGTGRRGGFILELPAKAQPDEELGLLVAHEAFHLWNGHKLVPEPAQEPKTRWFKEGLTHYVALQTCGALGLCSARKLLDELAGASQRHIELARGVSAPAMLAREPYDRGMLLAAAIDLQLRQDSQGQRTLDDWLNRLIQRSQQHPRWMYDEDALFEELKTLNKSPGLLRLWADQVQRRQPIALDALYRALGLHWLPRAGERAARLSPLASPAPLYERMLGLKP